jgi:neutral ceramidase
MFSIGLGKADITAFEKGSSMLGYGMYTHVALDVETPLYARAYIIEDLAQQHKIAIVNCEIAFITPLLKQSVVEYLDKHFPNLKINDNNLMLSAQHTHCSPAGFSSHAVYNISVPGFIQHILDTLVKGIIEAIVEAEQNKVKGNISIGKASFDDDTPVSFNRTVNSYNQNPEVKKYTFSQRHLAVDREMTLLNFISEQGNLLGSINWFAVHTTNLPNTFTKLCSDNKGFAADYLERNYQKKYPNYIGAFAQGACGDVSARVRYNPKLPFQRGKFEGAYSDDLKSSKFNGMLQYEKAKEIIDGSLNSNIQNEEIDFVLQYIDFSKIDILPAFNNGQEGGVTSPSVMGIAFLEGSKMDGPGMHPILGNASRIIANGVRAKELKNAKKSNDSEAEKTYRRYKAQGAKHLAFESGEKRIFGNTDVTKFFVPSFADPMIYNLKYFARLGLLSEHPWAPQILPVQIFKIGTIAIVGLPFEITTVSSWRLKKTIENTLCKNGFEHIILCPYSNAYNGYITTFEEYQVQDYEAGHCVFGQWSLNALQQVTHQLCNELIKKHEDRNIPFLQEAPISEKYLERFAYEKSYYYKKLEKKLNKKENFIVEKAKKYYHKLDKKNDSNI